MSNTVLPALAGLKYPASRMPIWSGKVQTAVSGKETRINYWSSPRYRWTIGYEVLREGAGSGATDLQQLVGFYNARSGQYDDWLFSDPDDNSVTGHLFGTGNGVKTVFPLMRSYGGYDEPVTAVNTITSIVATDFQGTTTLSAAAHSNYCLYSEQFDNAAWAKFNSATVVANSVAAPDGNTTADTLNLPLSNSALQMDTATTAIPSTTYTLSVWLYGTAGQTVSLQIGTTTGIGGSTVTAMTLTAGWVRYSVSVALSGAATGNLRVLLNRNSGTATTLYAWGTQIETGATPTRYLATTSAAITTADYAVDSYGVVTLPVALGSGGTLTWSGTYYWRVRWDDMDFALEKMMAGLWSSADLTFTSLK